MIDLNILELSDQEMARRNSLIQLKELGINPYPADEYPVNAWAEEIIKNFNKELTPPRQVCVAGRIMSDALWGKPLLSS